MLRELGATQLMVCYSAIASHMHGMGCAPIIPCRTHAAGPSRLPSPAGWRACRLASLSTSSTQARWGFTGSSSVLVGTHPACCSQRWAVRWVGLHHQHCSISAALQTLLCPCSGRAGRRCVLRDNLCRRAGQQPWGPCAVPAVQAHPAGKPDQKAASGHVCICCRLRDGCLCLAGMLLVLCPSHVLYIALSRLQTQLTHPPHAAPLHPAAGGGAGGGGAQRARCGVCR